MSTNEVSSFECVMGASDWATASALLNSDCEITRIRFRTFEINNKALLEEDVSAVRRDYRLGHAK